MSALGPLASATAAEPPPWQYKNRKESCCQRNSGEQWDPSLGPELKVKVGHFSSFGWVLVGTLNYIILLLNISRKCDLNGSCS